MTLADHLVHDFTPPRGTDVLQVCWSATMSAWRDRDGIVAGSNPTPPMTPMTPTPQTSSTPPTPRAESNGAPALPRPRHARVELILHIDRRGHDRARACGWLQVGETRRAVLDAADFTCTRLFENGLEHVDLFDGRQRLAAITIDRTGRVLYAQSVLPTLAGLGGATFDPPVARRGE